MGPARPGLRTEGTAWDAIAEDLDRYGTATTMAFAEGLLDRVEIGPGVRVLDVGAGTGAVAIPAARRGADVVAVDIAPTMIELLDARARAEGLSHLEGRVMDGQALELDDDTFDVVVSLNGVSVFVDPARGLAELVRVAAPGGTVVVAAFGAPHEAEFLGFFMSAMQVAVPGFTPPPPDPPLPPFRLADRAGLGRALSDAGARHVRIDTTTWDMRFDSATHFWDVVTHSNPIGARLVADLTAAQATEVQQVLDGMFRERSGGSPDVVLHTEMNLGIATA